MTREVAPSAEFLQLPTPCVRHGTAGAPGEERVERGGGLTRRKRERSPAEEWGGGGGSRGCACAEVTSLSPVPALRMRNGTDLRAERWLGVYAVVAAVSGT